MDTRLLVAVTGTEIAQELRTASDDKTQPKESNVHFYFTSRDSPQLHASQFQYLSL